MNRSIFIFLLLITFTACNSSSEKSNEPAANANPETKENVQQEYMTETVVTGIPFPWGMTWLPNGDMLITNRDGQLRLFSDGNLVEEPIDGVPEVWARGQGGLLDIALHPDYEENGWIYITYSNPEGGSGANTTLMRAKLNDDHTSLINQEELYKAEPNTSRGQHFGSRIEFDDEGYLYFSIGDRGNRNENPQDITRDGGKIYRLNPDGSIPEDNPFVGKAGAKEAIFTYGNRNPQGMARHPETGQIWAHEHGPRGGDEINLIEAGNNYGWPEICFCIDYDGSEITPDTAKAGMEQPEWYWDPSIAPSGMDFVTSDKYPEWQGDILVGSLKFGYIVRANVENNTVVSDEILFKGIGRVRNIRQGPDGYIYVATEGNGIVRIVPKDKS